MIRNMSIVFLLPMLFAIEAILVRDLNIFPMDPDAFLVEKRTGSAIYEYRLRKGDLVKHLKSSNLWQEGDYLLVNETLKDGEHVGQRKNRSRRN